MFVWISAVLCYSLLKQCHCYRFFPLWFKKHWETLVALPCFKMRFCSLQQITRCWIFEFPRKLTWHWVCACKLPFLSLYKEIMVSMKVKWKIRSAWWAGNYIKWCSVIRQNVQLILWLRCGRGIWSNFAGIKERCSFFVHQFQEGTSTHQGQLTSNTILQFLSWFILGEQGR